MVFIDMGLTW